jgi:hypothetical protein
MQTQLRSLNGTTIKLSKAMPQLNEYPIEHLKALDIIIRNGLNGQSPPMKFHGIGWLADIREAIADREFTDSQLPFRTPKEIEQDTKLNLR